MTRLLTMIIFPLAIAGAMADEPGKLTNTNEGPAWIYSSRISRCVVGKQGVELPTFPKTVHWYIALVENVEQTPGIHSLPRVDDKFSGRMWQTQSVPNRKKGRRFIVRFDDLNSKLCKSITRGDWLYVGVTDDFRLFEIYRHAPPQFDTPEIPQVAGDGFDGDRPSRVAPTFE